MVGHRNYDTLDLTLLACRSGHSASTRCGQFSLHDHLRWSGIHHHLSRLQSIQLEQVRRQLVFTPVLRHYFVL